MSLNKTILFLSLLSLLNSTASAHTGKMFYLKTIAAINKNSDIKTIDSDINFILKQKANLSPTLGIGLGYNVNSFSRIDLVFENSNISFATKTGDFRFYDSGILNVGTRTIKRNANIQSFMLNGYINVIDKSAVKVFIGAGAGVGYSIIKEKSFDRFETVITVDGRSITLPTIYSYNTNKNKKAFSYAFMIGADFNVCNNFNVELGYSWKHAGKVKADDSYNKYRGHNVSLGARFGL